MKYEQLIETVSLIVENSSIQKQGLSLFYELAEADHNKLNEEIFRKANPYSVAFQPEDEFEVLIGNILVKFKKLQIK